jgi:hypothetical protein
MPRSSPNSFTPGAISAIGKRHTCAVDSLVPQPGALILVRVQIDDRFANWAIEHLEVNRQAQVSGAIETLDVVANEQPAQGKAAAHAVPYSHTRWGFGSGSGQRRS